MEDVVQDEASRRRMRVLAHLPLTATFKLCEVELAGEPPLLLTAVPCTVHRAGRTFVLCALCRPALAARAGLAMAHLA